MDGDSGNKKTRKLPVGISDFKSIIDGNYCYVDKTLFIKEVLDLLLTAGRAYGDSSPATRGWEGASPWAPGRATVLHFACIGVPRGAAHWPAGRPAGGNRHLRCNRTPVCLLLNNRAAAGDPGINGCGVAAVKD
ncbi:MAG: AAA family ATPase [bacterium]|nr:AAA family ATPase [bacterium]